MRALLQRVAEAEVFAGGKRICRIGKGLLVYLGVSSSDTKQALEKAANKVASLRIFDDADGKLNLSVDQAGGGILVVPNFTLLGDPAKGRRPSYANSAPADVAEPLFEHFVETLSGCVSPVEKGLFGADMTIESVARGPVNMVVDVSP